MPKMSAALLVSLLWCAGVLAQELLGPRADGSVQQPVSRLGLVLAEVADSPGVTVVGIVEPSPASAGGFLPRDVVLRIGEHAITRIADVIAALDQAAPGASIAIVVRRGDREQTLQVTARPPRF
jgi:S1-C subfamily serine protease